MIIKFQKTTLKFDTGLLSWKVGKNTNEHVQWGEIVSEKEDSLLSTVFHINISRKIFYELVDTRQNQKPPTFFLASHAPRN